MFILYDNVDFVKPDANDMHKMTWRMKTSMMQNVTLAKNMCIYMVAIFLCVLVVLLSEGGCHS